jgi:hypothetical protein
LTIGLTDTDNSKKRLAVYWPWKIVRDTARIPWRYPAR